MVVMTKMIISCLPDNRELDFCHEMMDQMSYPKLECGLSAMQKDQLADCLAHNNLKVNMWFCILFFHEYDSID
jgi:hypothetical protein